MKRTLYFAAAILFAGLLFGCGSSQVREDEKAKADAEEALIDERERLLQERLASEKKIQDGQIERAKKYQDGNPLIIYNHFIRENKERKIKDVQVFLFNNGKKTIFAYEIEFKCFDDKGRPVLEKKNRSNVYVGYSKGFEIESGEVDKPAFDLEGMDKTEEIRGLRVNSVTFSDKSKWRPGRRR